MKLAAAIGILALAWTATTAEGACRYARCGHLHAYGRVHARGSGRVVTPVLRTGRTRSQHLATPTLTERPVQPGNAPLPAYLPNNAPPVFAPQPIP